MNEDTRNMRREDSEASAAGALPSPVRRWLPGSLSVTLSWALLAMLPGVLSVSLLLAPDGVSAHHSPAVFDRTRQITVAGVVREFRWGNPHSWIHLDVADDEGNIATWSVEMNPATMLGRNGWTRRTLEPGDRVEVRVYPLRNDEKGGQYISVTLPDGRVMDEASPPVDVVGP